MGPARRLEYRLLLICLTRRIRNLLECERQEEPTTRRGDENELPSWTRGRQDRGRKQWQWAAGGVLLRMRELEPRGDNRGNLALPQLWPDTLPQFPRPGRKGDGGQTRS